MSYDLMVFNCQKVPCEFGQLRPWLHTHMEEDVLPEKTPALFCSFLEQIQNIFPPADACLEDQFHDACDYEIHEDFIYLCFAYSAAEKAHGIVKRQAKADHLGFGNRDLKMVDGDLCVLSCIFFFQICPQMPVGGCIRIHSDFND